MSVSRFLSELAGLCAVVSGAVTALALSGVPPTLHLAGLLAGVWLFLTTLAVLARLRDGGGT